MREHYIQDFMSALLSELTGEVKIHLPTISSTFDPTQVLQPRVKKEQQFSIRASMGPDRTDLLPWYQFGDSCR